MDTKSTRKARLKIRQKLMFLFAYLIVLSLTLGQAGLKPALALPGQPPDPIDPDPIGSPLPFTPPADGFSWTVPSRFGGYGSNGMIDFHWNPDSMTYDPSYIYPTGWPMYFYGCQTEQDDNNSQSTPNTYKWELDGKVFNGHSCTLAYDKPGFSAQGTYTVTLTVTDSNGAPIPVGKNPPYFQQQVYIKDYFIVSIGDSFASGEGNPDIQQGVQSNFPLPGWHQTSPPAWEDKRCNRSSYAGPARAAMDLEAMDPHTSVTFISFACAGATINTPTYAMVGLQALPPFVNFDPDPDKPQGSGVLGPYIGIEPDGVAYKDYAHYIPSQMSQVQTALTPPAGKTARTIDSLLVSAGGNDLHFADIVKACLLGDDCWNNDSVRAFDDPSTGSFPLPVLVDYVLKSYQNGGSPTNLPYDYQLLNGAIQNLSPKPAKVYITQYPDLTRDDNGNYCKMLDDVFTPLTYAIYPGESEDAANDALFKLNGAVQQAAAKYGWQLVDGLASYQVDPDPTKPAGTLGLFALGPDGKGHGYCASDNWIRRADESELMQGPVDLRALTQGTVHPTSRGHQAYKERILYYMLPILGAQRPSAPPKFSTSLTSGGLTSTAGANGWYTGSCNGSTCYPKVVLQTTAKGTTQMRGASVTINGQAGCGSLCTQTAYTSTNEVKWDFAFPNDGTYRMQFSAQDASSQVATFATEIKVDLHDPYFTANPGPFSVDEGGSVVLTAKAADAASGTLNYAWDLDNNGSFETTGQSPTFSAASLDGPTSQTVGVRVTDDAGRSATKTTNVDVANIAPAVSITAPADATLFAINAQISLSASFTDPGAADTFTCSIDWDNGSTTTGTLAGKVCTASKAYAAAGVYTIKTTVTDDDGGTDTESVMAVVYDPSAGFVTGGGWINSPAGAYIADPSLTGQATFGFVSKYQKGQTKPTGQTDFQFDAGSFYFESNTYEWLVVSGAKAQFKGSGSVNGLTGYSFLLTATDGQVNGGGGVDKFRIKVWNAAGVVYDNQLGSPDDIDGANPQAIGGGNIVIHSSK